MCRILNTSSICYTCYKSSKVRIFTSKSYSSSIETCPQNTPKKLIHSSWTELNVFWVISMKSYYILIKFFRNIFPFRSDQQELIIFFQPQNYDPITSCKCRIAKVIKTHKKIDEKINRPFKSHYYNNISRNSFQLIEIGNSRWTRFKTVSAHLSFASSNNSSCLPFSNSEGFRLFSLKTKSTLMKRKFQCLPNIGKLSSLLAV
jgi:hypothetical protein